MAGLSWFRLYHEMLDDPKIGTLSDSEFRLWVELLCLACRASSEGDTGLTIDETSWMLRRNVTETLQKLLSLEVVTLLNGKKSSTIGITNWNKRQYKSDSSTPRVKKHREKIKQSEFDDGETFQ